jgi:SAM-dependent methyltransferase
MQKNDAVAYEASRNVPRNGRYSGMRVVTIIETGDDADVAEDVALRALACSDAVLAVCHPAPDGTREILTTLTQQGRHLVVFDDPAPPPVDRARSVEICRNTRRFFKPDVLLWLNRRERLAWNSRESLERWLPGETGSAVSDAPGRPARRRHTPQYLTRAQIEAMDGIRTSAAPDPLASLSSVAGVEPAPAPRSWVTRLDPVRWLLRRARRSSNHIAPPDARTATPDDGLAGRDGRATPATTYDAGPDRSGVWDEWLHAQNLYVDRPPFRYLWDKFGPGSILDVGCGLGAYLQAFRTWGARETVGIDGFDNSGAVLRPEAYRRHDLRTPLELGRTFDLVVCTEVIEHIDAEHEAIVLQTVSRHARGLILFSAARPGQPGVGHVNCKPMDYWLDRWAHAGWEPDVFDTLAVRSLSTFFWFRRNLIVLRSAGSRPAPAGFTIADLASDEAERVDWFAQPPAIHTYPLQSPLAPIRPAARATSLDRSSAAQGGGG